MFGGNTLQVQHLIIIGAMKAGTSSLFNMLATHPDIIPAITKEPEYFSENQSHELKTVRDYSELWPGSDDAPMGKYLLEASTGYSKFPSGGDVPRRMKEYGIKPKFIYIVRDPIKRIESQINWAVKRPWFNPADSYTHSRYISPSRYAAQLDRYMAHFDKDDLLLLGFEELKSDPGNLLKKVSDFLGIEYSFDEEAARIIKNATFSETVGERFVYRTPMIHRFYSKAPYRFREYVRKNILAKTPPVHKITLKNKELESVKAALRDDMARLRSEYGFDTRVWGF